MSLSRLGAEKIKALWADFVEKLEPVIRDSPEEELYAITWDFFKA